MINKYFTAIMDNNNGEINKIKKYLRINRKYIIIERIIKM